jgi:PAS domain S-box-containing protein
MRGAPKNVVPFPTPPTAALPPERPRPSSVPHGGDGAALPDLLEAIDLAPVALLVHDRGVILRANDPAKALMNATEERPLEGRNVMEFVTDRSRKLVRDRYDTLHEAPRRMDPVEYEIVRIDGERIDVEMASRSFLHEGHLLVMTVLKDITVRKEAQRENERLIEELTAVLERVGRLEGILPICSGCKKIRDEHGHWRQVEEYVAKRTAARFSHSFCPDCMKRIYPGPEAP